MTDRPGEMPVSIRPMALGDVEAVYAIDKMSFSMPWSERTYRYELTENRNTLLLVAEAASPGGSRELVGMLVTWLIVDEAHIGTIAVHPGFRRQGIGRRLIATCLLEVRSRGAQQALLEVRRSNLEAQRLYKRFGFEVVGLRPRYYRDNNEDAILMTLKNLDERALRQLAAERLPGGTTG